MIGIGLAAFAAVITVFCLEENRADKNFSATTAIAGIAHLRARRLCAASATCASRLPLAVVAAGLLAMRESLHGWVKSLTWPELRSGLILLAMTFIALPLVPDDPVGPFGGVNPREIWLIAIVLAGVSFLGYAAVKYFGERHGVLLAAAAGGLVSSTAVTLANARRAAAGEGSPQLLAAGVVAGDGSRRSCACSRSWRCSSRACWSCSRRRLPPRRSWPSASPSCWVYWRAGRPTANRREVKFRNPFGFWSVIGLALVAWESSSCSGRLLEQYFGSAGAVIGAAALGLFDVDAVTVSMARLVPQPLERRQAALCDPGGGRQQHPEQARHRRGIGPRPLRGRHRADVGRGCRRPALAALWPALLFAPVG